MDCLQYMKSTVFLPNTKFLARIKSSERAALDSRLASLGDLHGFYEWQSRCRKSVDKEFTLLDGPPYANGPAHVGHAINKIQKDFIVKSRALTNYRVHYRPGWDCHGLPIELKIKKEHQDIDPLEIRYHAGELALNSIRDQMNTFKRWGVSADWPNYYCTMNTEYIVQQLKIFADLYEKGFVYRDYKPVYWSPSSQTALAESELEYNANHKSLGVYFRFHIINFDLERFGLSSTLKSTATNPVYIFALIWTTTPWTLPMNNAIAYSQNLKYSIVEFNGRRRKAIREVFVIAESLLPRLRVELNDQFIVHGSVESSCFQELFYRSPTYSELALPFVEANFVNDTMGTGLVHCSYAHGFDDYKIALNRGDRVECFVDEKGRYTRQMGYSLEDKEVLSDGADAVLDLLRKHVVHTADYVHSYPYDWRTKKPIIIRSSEQWFMDVSRVGRQCADLINSKNIKIAGGDHDQTSALVAQLTNRPSWCISRQRVWGVPIPYVVNKVSKTAETSGDFIRFFADVVKKNGEQGADLWWKLSASDLLKDKACPTKFLSSKNLDYYEKGAEIMDVWLDSGVAWHTLDKTTTENFSANENTGVANVVFEGVDQFRGWFQSLSLTSVATKGKIPFEQILVHGFAVDDGGRKMSKSLGNVVVPDAVTDGTLKTDAIGADGLRLWVALYSAECVSDVRIGERVIEDVNHKLTQIRLMFRFILGALDGWEGPSTDKNYKLTTLDRYILHRTRQFMVSTEQNYNNYRFRTVANNFIQFLQNPLSSFYVNCVRDRLYCAPVSSPEHNAARFTLDCVGQALCTTIAPILPHLVIEYYSHHQILKNHCESALRKSIGKERDSLLSRELITSIISGTDEQYESEQKLCTLVDKCVMTIRTQLGQIVHLNNLSTENQAKQKKKAINLKNKGASIVASPQAFQLLNTIFVPGDHTCDLLELLGLSYAELTLDENANCSSEYLINTILIDPPANQHLCKRCRKIVAHDSNGDSSSEFCERCRKAISF